MPGEAYNSFWPDALNGHIDLDSDVFGVMLVDDTYVFNKDTHTRRSHITGEVVGSGYTAGGQVASVTVTNDTANDRTVITLGAGLWDPASVGAAGAVYFRRRGGAASADELVAFNSFGLLMTSLAAPFSVAASVINLNNYPAP